MRGILQMTKDEFKLFYPDIDDNPNSVKMMFSKISDPIEMKLIRCECDKCGEVLMVSPMTNMNSPLIKDCELHKKKENSTDE
jgi:hypothetical protein